MVKKFITLLVLTLFFSSPETINAQIVINSQFKPFTYDEMVAPLQTYANFYNQCCETLIGLMDNAEQIEAYINKEKEPITWRRYADYYNSILEEYNRIQKKGTNQGTRGRINDLKRNFSRVINGIANAYNRRSELSNNQSQRINSTHERCDRWYSEISLDEFLDGKTPSVSYY